MDYKSACKKYFNMLLNIYVFSKFYACFIFKVYASCMMRTWAYILILAHDTRLFTSVSLDNSCRLMLTTWSIIWHRKKIKFKPMQG